MAKQTLINKERAEKIRGKINQNFDEVYTAASEASEKIAGIEMQVAEILANEESVDTPVIIFNNIVAAPSSPYTLPLAGTGIKDVKISISGTSTSRTVTFKSKIIGGDTYNPWVAVNLSSPGLTAAVQTTGNNETWDISGLEGLDSLQFDATVSGGTLRVTAVTHVE